MTTPDLETPPRAFICHATADKARFVLRFAERLRESGIDAWLDSWEIRVGDSLPRVIFEDGIKNAQAFIVVISRESVTRPWVHAELDAGVVRRIQGQTRLVPVVLDGCEVPVSLQATKWVPINDLENYDEAVKEIVDDIYGVARRPPVGPPPRFVQRPVPQLDGLSETDSRVLASACAAALAKELDIVTEVEFTPGVLDMGLADSTIVESVGVLSESGLVKSLRTPGQRPMLLKVRPAGMQLYLRAEMPEYDAAILAVAASVVNAAEAGSTIYSSDIAAATSLSHSFVLHALDVLTSRGDASITPMLGGPTLAFGPSARLRRLVREG